MDEVVEQLFAATGELLEVLGRRAVGDRYRAIAFVFSSGTLQIRCNDDTDEVILESISDLDRAYEVADHPFLTGLEGMSLEEAWVMTNRRGYEDAFQIRLADRACNEHVRQFEVAASAIDVRQVVDPDSTVGDSRAKPERSNEVE